jgi:ABC-type antimicrobial peptide transport system permease subunit
MVVRQGALQLAVGLAVGLAAAFALASALGSAVQNILFGVSAHDPATYGSVVALITLVSLVATLVPARRATRVDPMVALRAE